MVSSYGCIFLQRTENDNVAQCYQCYTDNTLNTAATLPGLLVQSVVI